MSGKQGDLLCHMEKPTFVTLKAAKSDVLLTPPPTSLTPLIRTFKPLARTRARTHVRMHARKHACACTDARMPLHTSSFTIKHSYIEELGRKQRLTVLALILPIVQLHLALKRDVPPLRRDQGAKHTKRGTAIVLQRTRLALKRKKPKM